MTPEEIKKLQEDLASAEASKAALQKENAALKKFAKPEKADANPKAELPAKAFEVGGKKYKFLIPVFNVPGFGETTAKEALVQKDVLEYLVKEQSSVIEEVA